MTQERWANWAGNVVYQAVRTVSPRSIDELRAVVASGERVRAMGSGHSFSAIADTTATLVRLDLLPPVIDIDADRRTVRVSAGLRYADLGAPLHRAGFALANLASLPHISVAGAVATGTHGSGDRLCNLADAVTALRLVGAGGEDIELREGDAGFPGAVVSLGALGIVTELTLRIEPTFTVAQEVRLDVPLDELADSWEEIFAAAYSVSAFTTYASGAANVFLKRRSDVDISGWSGGRRADGPVHPIPGVDATACTTQLGVSGPWHERLPHFRPDLIPSAGQELQSEFFLPRAATAAGLAALRGLSDQLAPVLQIGEIRTMRGDELWLSPAYGRDTVGFHFTWVLDPPRVLPVVAAVEEALLPLGARAHWGKITTWEPSAMIGAYPRAGDFVALADRLDPDRRFGNAYTDAVLDAVPASTDRTG
jgi:xylitol oxidase